MKKFGRGRKLLEKPETIDAPRKQYFSDPIELMYI